METLLNNSSYIAVVCMFLCIVLLILLIVLAVLHFRLYAKYKFFMKGSDGKMLEDEMMRRFRQIDDILIQQDKMSNQIQIINDILKTTYQKMGVVKYDAFQEMGGKLSCTICLLNDKNDGIILDAIYGSRSGCYTYIKEIIDGKSYVELSGEEKEALDKALNK